MPILNHKSLPTILERNKFLDRVIYFNVSVVALRVEESIYYQK